MALNAKAEIEAVLADRPERGVAGGLPVITIMVRTRRSESTVRKHLRDLMQAGRAHVVLTRDGLDDPEAPRRPLWFRGPVPARREPG